ncbi:MAG: transposase [Kiritimatiellae bacterium]|nr:transposase [Kiritimatiellia bacterium]MDD4736162.1 transposase [Kiritimatiellia bacterium]
MDAVGHLPLQIYHLNRRGSVSQQYPPSMMLSLLKNRLKSIHGRELYKLRKQTVEPVFGIIKSVIGFTPFSLRGLAAVQGEWDLVALSYNMKRLFNLKFAGI